MIDNVLGAPNVTYTHEGINMADRMSGEEGKRHVCEHRVEREVKVRPDIGTTPLAEAEEVLFTDGCCYRHPEEGLKLHGQ